MQTTKRDLAADMGVEARGRRDLEHQIFKEQFSAL